MAVEISNGGSSGNTFLAFVVGAVLIAIVALGIFMFTGGHIFPQQQGPSINLHVKTPSVPTPTSK